MATGIELIAMLLAAKSARPVNVVEAAEAAQAAAEIAQDAAEEAQGKAEDAQEAAETAQAAAEVSAASIEQSAEQIDANTARIGYLALREEEDRQILFGSIVEAVEDTYDELRSAPIHTAITIGQSVYPRVDNTRLGLDRIKGRTVVDGDVLVAPVVSGVSFAGKNLLDVDAIAPVHSLAQNIRNGIEFTTPATYTIKANKNGAVSAYLSARIKMADGTYGTASFIVNAGVAQATVTFTVGNGDTLIVFDVAEGSTLGDTKSYFEGCEVQVEFGSTATEYEPYTPTTLSIPSTRLDGVGTAQDYIEVVEVAENDYSLIKHSLTGTRAYESGDESLAGAVTDGTNTVYTLATPMQNTIAEHLMLAEVSAIVENGGIISITNENGHIVQPDAVFDTVISRSAS